LPQSLIVNDHWMAENASEVSRHGNMFLSTRVNQLAVFRSEICRPDCQSLLALPVTPFVASELNAMPVRGAGAAGHAGSVKLIFTAKTKAFFFLNL